MKRRMTLMVVFLFLGMNLSVNGALLEFAGSCEDARAKLDELVKNPEINEIGKIMEALGVDLLASCDSAKGTVTCFQCLDKDKKLRSIQIFQDKESRRFTLRGYGCECTDQR
jgi:hypothetical protein